VAEKEAVLCIKRNLLPDSWVLEKSIVPLEFSAFIEKCTDAGFDFIKRKEAENDASYKQIIPYIVLQTSDLKKTAIYNRQGSEQRLHDLWSLGIGGHINPIDMKSDSDSFEKIMTTGLLRELDEELEQKPENDPPVFIGVISEDVTDVGRVHLGAVFRILTDSPDKYAAGSELFDFSWEETANLPRLNMELWSTLAMELIQA
jgi:predicted NUDIX family phosphoesterase